MSYATHKENYDSEVRARVPKELKIEANRIVREVGHGLTLSDVLRMTLSIMAKEKRLPFNIDVPNKETVKAMTELNEGKGIRIDDLDSLFK